MRLAALLSCIAGSVLVSCNPAADHLPAPGAVWTAVPSTRPTFIAPAPVLDASQKLDFWTGFGFFRDPWVSAPASTTARDGLGPLFNAQSCISCHAGGGRGSSLIANPDSVSTIVRFSANPSPHEPAALLGRQLQTRATYRSERGDSGKRYGGYYMGEGQLHVNTTERVAVFQDGEQLTLLRPEFNIETPTNSPAPAEMSVRIAPSLIGLSLLERIPDARLETLEDPKDANRDGVSGRIHWRTDTAGEPAPGRFGWKASHVSVASQTAVAFAEDIGITNPMERKQNCSEQQLDCLAQRHGADATEGVEVPGLLFDKVVFFTGNMAPPPAGALTPKVRLGQRMFSRAGCDSCHTPSHTLTVENADGESSSETIWPYTDLLLHDMGELLADSMHDGLAASGEWRTSPLWGLGLSLTVNETTGLLHDGRARTVAEAVAWHGGEGQDARDRFFDLNEKQRAALEAFVLAL